MAGRDQSVASSDGQRPVRQPVRQVVHRISVPADGGSAVNQPEPAEEMSEFRSPAGAALLVFTPVSEGGFVIHL